MAGIGDQVLEGAGWALLGLLTRTAARRGLGASAGTSDLAGLAVPIASSLLLGGNVGAATVGSAIGVAAAEVGDRVSTGSARIIVFGDTHGTISPRKEIIGRMALEPAVDLYVFLGDAEGWDRWYEDTAMLRAKARVIPLPGNHDDKPGRAVGGIDLPAVFRVADCNLVLLGDPPTKSAVETVMGRIDRSLPLTLVCLHRSPIPFSRQNTSGAVVIRDALLPLLERGCTLLCGHHHVYGWGVLGSSMIITAGIAGSKHYDCNCDPPCEECDDEVRGYLRVILNGTISTTLVPVTVDHERS